MAFKGLQFVLTGGTRQKISADTSDAIAGQSVGIMPAAVDLFVGDSTVTTSGGTVGAKIAAGDSWSVDLDPRESLYVISATGTTISVTQQGV